MKLYHYVHCPYCIRVRMAANFLNKTYESIIVGYHNEQLPIKLTKKKMLPIAELDNGLVLNESLDIIKEIDFEQVLFNDLFIQQQIEVEALLKQFEPNLFKLSMPYMMWTPEFSPEAREYFQRKKEQKRGPFNELILNRGAYESELSVLLKNFEEKLDLFYQSKKFGLVDILIASHLWSLFLVPEFQFSGKVYDYLLRIKKETNFEYHIDYWHKQLDWSEFWQSL